MARHTPRKAPPERMPLLDTADVRPWIWEAVPPGMDLVYIANAARQEPYIVVDARYAALLKGLEAHAAALSVGRTPLEAARLAADLADLFPYTVHHADAFPFVRRSLQDVFTHRLYPVFDALRAWAGQLPSETDDVRRAVVLNAMASGDLKLQQALEGVASIKGRVVSPDAVRKSLHRAQERERRLRHPMAHRPVVLRPEPKAPITVRPRPFRVPGWLAEALGMPPKAVAALSRALRAGPEGVADASTSALLQKAFDGTQALYRQPPAGTLGGTVLLQSLDAFPVQLQLDALGAWYWQELAQLFVQRAYAIFDTLRAPGRPPGVRS